MKPTFAPLYTSILWINWYHEQPPILAYSSSVLTGCFIEAAGARWLGWKLWDFAPFLDLILHSLCYGRLGVSHNLCHRNNDITNRCSGVFRQSVMNFKAIYRRWTQSLFCSTAEKYWGLVLAEFTCEPFAVEKTTDWGIQLAKTDAIAAVYLHLFCALRLFSSR